MVKFTMCLRKRADLSRDEFYDYWLNKHGPLVISLAPALRIRKYNQVHALDHQINEIVRKTRNLLDPFEGVAETWFENLEDLEGSFATPEGREAGLQLREDEAKFLDLTQCAGWISQEHVMIPG